MGERRGAYRVLVGKSEGRRPHFEGPSVDGRIMLKWILEKLDGVGMDWLNMTEDRDRWRILVSAVMNLRFP
jgi:hypothetical protein